MSEQEYNHYQNDVSAWEADRAYWYQKAQTIMQNSLLRQPVRAGTRSGSGGKGNKVTSVPDNYKDFAAQRIQSGIMTASEFTKQRHPDMRKSQII